MVAKPCYVSWLVWGWFKLQGIIDKNPENIAILRDMYQNWPFFQSLLSNVDMVLSKSNMNIAFEYAKLCEDEEVKAIYETILNEWQVTKEVILAIEGYDELLAENPYLKASLDYRMPYFNILNYIQLELIKTSTSRRIIKRSRKINPYNHQRNCDRIA